MSSDVDLEQLATEFNEQNGLELLEQTVKLSEETGEVSEAVLGVTGRLLFKEPFDVEDVADELVDLIVTARYVADLAGVEDLDSRVRERLEENLDREGSS